MDGERPNDYALRRRLRFRRHRRRAYIRSVYFLPSLATLGNAVCGFAAIYIAHLDPNAPAADPIAHVLAQYQFLAASYLLILAMIFDALDGRLARWTRHTTDFGGQLDSMADVISFGAAPAMIALALFKSEFPDVPLAVSRMVWAIGAVYMCCAAIRLARFNVSNEHGEQAHMSFLGLPSPGAAAAVIGLVLIQQDLRMEWIDKGYPLLKHLATTCTVLLPLLVLASGLLMVSAFRYPHLVNKYMRGKRTIGRLVVAALFLVLLVGYHRYTFGLVAIGFALSAPFWWLWLRYRFRSEVGETTQR